MARVTPGWKNQWGGTEVPMRSKILYGTMAILGLVLGMNRAFANSGAIQAEIPFEFVIGGKVLPPANYTFDIATDTGPSVLPIRTMTTGERVMFDTSQIPDK